MNKVGFETVVRLYTSDAVLEVGTDPDTEGLVEIRTPDARSIEWYGEARLGLQPEVAVALAHAILKVAKTLEDDHDLREAGNRHEILAGAYQSSSTRYERELKEWIERGRTAEEKAAALKWLEDMRDAAQHKGDK